MLHSASLEFQDQSSRLTNQEELFIHQWHFQASFSDVSCKFHLSAATMAWKLVRILLLVSV